MVRRRLALLSIALVAAVAIGQTAPSKPVKSIKLELGKKSRFSLVKDDPAAPGCSHCKVFQFTAPADGDCTVTASSRLFNVMLCASDGDATDLVESPLSDFDLGPGDGERVTIPVTKSQTYRAVVASTNEELGEFDIDVAMSGPQSTGRAASWKEDYNFFRESFDFATSKKLPARAAYVALRAAEAAIQLGRATDAEEMVRRGKLTIDAATQLSADETDLDRVGLGIVTGQIAANRSDWETAVASFSDAEKRCDRTIDLLDRRKAPDDLRRCDQYRQARIVALVGHYEVEHGRGHVEAALPYARKVRECEKSDPGRFPVDQPMPMESALLELLDLNELYDEATKLEPECTERIKKCDSPPPEVVIAYCRFLIGRGHDSEAIERMRAALGRAEAEGDERWTIELAGELSATFLELGNYVDSQEMAERMRKAAGTVRDDVAMAQALIGLAEAQRNQVLFAPAREDAEAARKLLVAVKAAPRSADALVSLMMTDLGESKYDDAAKRIDEIDRIRSKPDAGEAVDLTWILARNELGLALMSKAIEAGSNDFEAARAVFEQMLKEAESIHDRHGAALARTHLGEIERLKGNHEGACDLSHQAADELRKLGRFEELHYPLLTIAKSKLSAKDPVRARAALMEARQSLENPTQQGLLGPSAGLVRAHLFEWGEIEQELVAADLASATDAKRRDELQRDGAIAAWRWKTRALLWGMLDHARRREEKDNRAWNRLHEQLARQDRDSATLVRASMKPADKERIPKAEKDLAESTARASEAAKKLRAEESPQSEEFESTVADLRKLVLGRDTLLIEYVNGAKQLIAYAIDAESVRRFELGPREEIETKAAKYLELLSSSDDPSPLATAGAELYRLLLGPILENAPTRLTRLLIAPTTRLGALPFDALVTDLAPKKGSQLRLDEIRYVLEHWIVSDVPSGAVAVELARQRARGGQGAWLLLGAPSESAPGDGKADPKAQRGGSAQPAKGMCEQLIAVADRLTKGTDLHPKVDEFKKTQRGTIVSDRFELYLGPEANREVLRDDLQRFAVLEFACHGDFNRNDPRGTALLLAPKAGDSGHLSVLDVLELELDANLTILSACSSARGLPVDGDGEQSLARAFLLAGSRSVVATLWSVKDTPTSLLMQDFDERVGPAAMASASHADFALELREAKLRSRREPKKSHGPASDDQLPRHWAGVICFGIGPKN